MKMTVTNVVVEKPKGRPKLFKAHTTIEGQRQHYQSMADEANSFANQYSLNGDLAAAAEHRKIAADYELTASDNRVLEQLATAARARLGV